MMAEVIDCSECGQKCCSCAFPCKCKQARCAKCGRCSKGSKCPHKTAIKCCCEELKRKQRNEKSKARRVAKKAKMDNQTHPQQENISQTPTRTSTRSKNPIQQVLSSEFDAASPGTIAKQSLLNNKKLNTPQQRIVTKAILDPNEKCWVLDEEIPSCKTVKEKTSFDTTTTGRMQTSGDVIQFFGLALDKNLKRNVGPRHARANSNDFPSKYPKEFKKLCDIACNALQETASALAPSCKNELVQSVCAKLEDHSKVQEERAIIKTALMDFFNKCNQRSTERRTTGALLYYLDQETNLDLKLPTKTSVQRKEDFEEISASGKVKNIIHRRQRKSSEVIEDVVNFLTSEENAITLSLGTTKKVINGKDFNLPKIVRRMQISDLWALYSRSKNELPASEKVGHTSFYRIAGEITTEDSDSPFE